ncbi:MAG: methionine--tRNA ligase [Candidatus Bathyarchaeia archaeon]
MALRSIIVTCALPYANGEIHLGHVASTYLPADIFVRYLRLKGERVVFSCATDDFGTPILIKAEEEGKTPEEYVAYWHERDREDFERFGISFDIFYKTSSEENIKLAQYFFLKLYEKNYIYKKEISQLYCPRCQKFLPDRYVRGTCPYCNSPGQYGDGCEACGKTFSPDELIDASCSICGAKPTYRRSEHFIFKLSEFSERLKEWLLGNKNLQEDVKNYVLKWIEEGLKDWDITRDITWGVPIPLPSCEGKVLYGWFDNHIGYISTTIKYVEEKHGIDGKEFWNSSEIYHFIGKDIVYHHYLFLPSMRMGVGEYKLPDFIPTRGHLLLHKHKFSKSRGWYISLRRFMEEFPPDYLRFYLTLITHYDQSDINFELEDFRDKVNGELVSNLGNFIHRTLTFIWNNFQGQVPSPNGYDGADLEFKRELEGLGKIVGGEIERNHMDRALRAILDFSKKCNQYFQSKEPWKDKAGSTTCINLCSTAVWALSIALEPFMPQSANELSKILGANIEKRWDLLDSPPKLDGLRIGKPSILFRKVDEKKIERMISELGI